jgi:hypothetical protein
MYAEVEAQGGKDAVQTQKRRIVLDAWRRGVEAALAAGDEARQVVSFCSAPRRVDQFLICTVLQLNRRIWKKYFTLRKDENDEAQSRPASLVESTAMQYVRKCAVGLAEHEAGGLAPETDWDHEEILRSAGRALADFPALGGRKDVTRRGLFHACNTISSLNHEGEPARGSLILSPPGVPLLRTKIHLKRPVRLYDYTAARKLLETTRPGHALLSDGAVIYGLGSMDLRQSIPGESLFHVQFLGHYTWELSYGTRALMRVTYGHPRLPSLPMLEVALREHAARVFPALSEVQLDTLWELTCAGSEQPHGTILVFHEGAAEEAQRLIAQAAPVEPSRIDAESLLSVSSVDGAVLVDPSGVCHAFGVILDGRATSFTNPSRGSRFNSAVRYVQSSERPCLAVVVSEDGTVDLVTRRDGV